MPTKFFHPKYWLTWLGISLLRSSVFLPWTLQMSIGKGLGKLLYIALPSRRKVSCINIEVAFPDLKPEEREKLNRQHFISLGRGVFEAALGWWGSDKQIQKLAHIEGLEHLENTLKNHRVILLGSHFVSLEMLGRIVALHTPLHAVYRPHQNKLIDYIVDRQRNKQYGKVIPKNNIRDMIKSIKEGFPVWYATDQNYQRKGSINVPFFGTEAPTNSGTSRLAKITNAKIVPCITVRLDDDKSKRKGYLLRILPPLEDFPSADAYQDTTRLNKIIEEQIQDFPSQYLWTHKRYKDFSTGTDFYQDYMLNQKSSCT